MNVFQQDRTKQTIFGSKVVARRNNVDTNGIEALMLEDGRILTIDEAIDAVRFGNSTGINIGSNQYGEHLRSLPDAGMTNNLKNLPRF